MIVIDSSAVLSIFLNEMHAEQLAWAIALDNQPIISAANVLETSIVLRSKKRLSGVEAERWLDRFIEQGRLFIAEVTSEQSILARQAHALYGKGSGHKAQLNFGDCFAYALAKINRAPLLYVGADFAYTDLQAAVAPSL